MTTTTATRKRVFAFTRDRFDQEKLDKAHSVIKCLMSHKKMTIIRALEKTPGMNVTEIERHLARKFRKRGFQFRHVMLWAVSQAATSQILGHLRKAKLVTCERDGKNIHYYLNKTTLARIEKALFNFNHPAKDYS